ncbi:hypothetical protein COY27_00995 [Candidatus Woesearchaeota archaeon CG_4_10_14_0_2_um_filter_33_13]|nr:MAG: hypothetical protein COY27_00995 [Candidatus Woesearchaeota archaeon CG_4_10_14_0_2_um_filter_33_13]
MIDTNKELFYWGPIPGRPIYISYFMESIANRSPKLYKWKWPEFVFYFIKKKMTFICEDEGLRIPGKKYFEHWIMQDDNFNLVKNRYQQAKEKLHNIHHLVKKTHKLTDEQFKNLFLQWQEAYLTFWDHGLVPEMANWGGEVLLKEKLSKVPKNKFAYVYEKLTAPKGLSFYQEEELDLLKSNSISEHQKRYYWINNSYFDSGIVSVKEFSERLNKVEDKNKEIQRIGILPKKTEEERAKVIKDFNLSLEIEKISNRLSYSIYWQDERKGNIFQTNHFIKVLLTEISRRYNIPVSHLEQYWCWEIPQIFSDKIIKEKEMRDRLEKQAGYMAAKDGNHVWTSEKFDHVVGPFLNINVDVKKKEVKGVSVNVGKIRGKARILFDPKDHIEKGEILIAPMTSPEYIVALRKAVAVVTDAGGMTCHAAIVARELGIPGIVATKIATKVFKDGDLVEVDANNGIVRKIE